MTALVGLSKLLIKRKRGHDSEKGVCYQGHWGNWRERGRTESYFIVFTCKILDEYFFNCSKQYLKKLLF